jgi:hypothetical protein
MPWFEGVSLFEFLEGVPVGQRAVNTAFRFPVQRVIRPDLDFRGYAGQIASGVIRQGDRVVVLPSRRTSRVKSIVTFAGDLEQAQAPQSVTLTLEDDIDIARGDMLAAGADPQMGSLLNATLVWLNEEPLDLKKRYRLKHTSRLEWAQVDALDHRININTLAPEPAGTLAMNEIGVARVSLSRPLYCDPYGANRTSGAFVLIDPFNNATVAAGMIQSLSTAVPQLARHPVSPAERIARHRHRGAVIWVGHREGVASILERRLFDHGSAVVRFTDRVRRSTEWSDTWKLSLVEAAWLVILSANRESAESSAPFDALIETAEGAWTVVLPPSPAAGEESSLDAREADNLAVEEIFDALNRLGILLPEQEWIDRGGI